MKGGVAKNGRGGMGKKGREKGRWDEVNCNGNFVSQAKNALRMKLGLATTTTAMRRASEREREGVSSRDREGKWAKSRINFAAFCNHFNCPNNAVAWAKANPFSAHPPLPLPSPIPIATLHSLLPSGRTSTNPLRPWTGLHFMEIIKLITFFARAECDAKTTAIKKAKEWERESEREREIGGARQVHGKAQ